MLNKSWFESYLSRQFKVAPIIWIAMLSSIFAYGFVLFSLINNFQQAEASPWSNDLILANSTNTILFCAAIGAVAISFALKKLLFNSSVLSKTLSTPWNETYILGASQPNGARLYAPHDVPELVKLKGQEQIVVRIVHSYNRLKIVQFAVAESAAVIGFTLSFLLKNMVPFYMLATLAGLALIVHRPNKNELLAKAEELMLARVLPN